MPIVNLPYESIYWSNVDNHDKIKKDLLPKIQKLNRENPNDNPFENACKFSTNLRNENNLPIDDTFLHDIIWKHVFEYMKIIDFEVRDPSTFKLEYWYNIYNDGDFQEVHSHAGPFVSNGNETECPWISGIYILDDTSEKQYISFFSSMSSQPFPSPDLRSGYSMCHRDIKEGTVLLFPSTLNHSVIAKDRNSPRTTIAFNVNAVFKE